MTERETNNGEHGEQVLRLPLAEDLHALSDEELLYFYDRLHHPDLIVEQHIRLLQDEVLRRGLRQRS